MRLFEIIDERPSLFIDSDGVVFNFDDHVKRFSGGISPNRLGDVPLWTLVNSIPDFWETMPLFPWSRHLIEFCRPYQPTILTGCPRTGYENAAEKKIAKYSKYFPGIPVIVCLSRNKANYMKKPGDVLVDDTHKNCSRWTKAGGRAIFFVNAEQTIAELTEIFERQQHE